MLRINVSTINHHFFTKENIKFVYVSESRFFSTESLKKAWAARFLDKKVLKCFGCKNKICGHPMDKGKKFSLIFSFKARKHCFLFVRKKEKRSYKAERKKKERKICKLKRISLLSEAQKHMFG